MSMATRCTSCGTVFRVVHDQLKVSEGWVRCGRCDAVFNAAENLFDLAQETTPAPLERAAPQVATNASSPPAPTDALAPSADSGPLREHVAAEAAAERIRPPHEAHAESPADAAAVFASPEPDATSRESGATNRIAIAVANADPPLSDMPAAPHPPAAARPEAMPAPPPGFVRRAQRNAFWQSRRVRALLGAAALLFAVLLSMQAAQQFSELAAARWPVLRPALAAWCGATGCSVGPPHRIDDMVVENTALAPAAGFDALRLSVGLRNRAPYPVALPSIDLSLTDNAGRLIARRALSPHDLQVGASTTNGATNGTLPAAAETTLQALVGAPGAARVAGYTVEIFYP